VRGLKQTNKKPQNLNISNPNVWAGANSTEVTGKQLIGDELKKKKKKKKTG